MDPFPLRLTVAALFLATIVGVGSFRAGISAGATDIAPKKWDRRVAELADFVEHRRGLKFDHPVQVRFVSERRFEKELKRDERDLAPRDRERLDALLEPFRALGLVRGSSSRLLSQSQEHHAEAVLGFYDPDREEVVVRDAQPDLAKKVTVVHELTHVAQDQAFDLDKLFRKAGRGGRLAASALMEGDAARTELAYVLTLSNADQTAYFEEVGRQLEQLDGDDFEPAVLPLLGIAPYVLGPAFLQAVVAERGEQGIDATFRNPPKSDEHVLTPSAYFEGDNPKRVHTPKLVYPEKQVGKAESFGAVSLFATLMWHLPTEVALDAAMGWGGDSLVRFEAHGKTCVHIAFTGDTPGDTEQLAVALQQWAAHSPDAAYTHREGDTTTLTSCDPYAKSIVEEKIRDGENKLRVGDGVLRTHAGFLLGAVSTGDAINIAECVADRVARDTFVRAFFEAGTPPDDQQSAELTDRVATARASCGAPG